MTFLKLERLASKLRDRVDEEWKKLEYLYAAKQKDEKDDWPEFDGDDYFTQLQFYLDCKENLNSCTVILYSDEKIRSASILLSTEQDILKKLEKLVETTRNTLKSINIKAELRYDYTKLIDMYEKQRKLVSSIDEDLASLKISTEVDIPKELDIFLSKYAN